MSRLGLGLGLGWKKVLIPGCSPFLLFLTAGCSFLLFFSLLAPGSSWLLLAAALFFSSFFPGPAT